MHHTAITRCLVLMSAAALVACACAVALLIIGGLATYPVDPLVETIVGNRDFMTGVPAAHLVFVGLAALGAGLFLAIGISQARSHGWHRVATETSDAARHADEGMMPLTGMATMIGAMAVALAATAPQAIIDANSPPARAVAIATVLRSDPGTWRVIAKPTDDGFILQRSQGGPVVLADAVITQPYVTVDDIGIDVARRIAAVPSLAQAMHRQIGPRLAANP